MKNELTPPEASPPALTAVLAMVTTLWTVVAVVEAEAAVAPAAAASAAAFAALAAALAAEPIAQPSCATMIEMLMMSEAASCACDLLMPYFSCRCSDSLLVSDSIAPVSFMTSAVTASAAPAMANAAAAPPVTTVTTTAATTARIAPSQPKTRLAMRAFSASSIFLNDASSSFMRSLCSVSRLSFWISMRSFAICVWRSSLSSCR